MTEAILFVRCHSCGQPLCSQPDYAPRADRWIECNHEQCSEYGKRYMLPTVQLQPYRENAAGG